MSADTENFPRGGKRIIPNEVKRKHEDNLFSHNKEPKAKKPRKDNRRQRSQQDEIPLEENWLSSIKLHGTLTYNKIQEGIVVLACVKQISNLAVHVESPGLTFGRVTINNISDKFTEVISEGIQTTEDFVPSVELSKILSIGQLVVTKITNLENTEKGHQVHATINPKDVYEGLSPNAFKKGATIWACVVSELDHGYELSVGTKNCRIFLPFKNVSEGVRYSLGQPLFCVIHKCQDSTFTVSAKKEHIDKVQLTEAPNIQILVPGTKIEFIVREVLLSGIKGKFLDQFNAYLDRTHFFSKVRPDKIYPSSTIQANVLFVEPVTKIVYLTLRNLGDSVPEPKYEIGQYVKAEITEHLPHGMGLKIEKTDKGFITNRRLGNAASKDIVDSEVLESVRAKYRIGSFQRSRVLDYNSLEQIYICTFEPKLLKEKVFSNKDLQLGLKIDVKIIKIVPNGLIVKVGNVQGFVPNLHLSNTNYANAIKGKFKEGQVVTARVLNITDDGNVVFTLKPGLVDTEKCLTNYKDAIRGSQFVGFIVQAKSSGALVAFYGDVKGWITHRDLNSGEPTDPRDYFFRGQVVNVYSFGVKDGKLQVSLNPIPVIKNEKKLKTDKKEKKLKTNNKEKKKNIQDHHLPTEEKVKIESAEENSEEEESDLAQNQKTDSEEDIQSDAEENEEEFEDEQPDENDEEDDEDTGAQSETEETETTAEIKEDDSEDEEMEINQSEPEYEVVHLSSESDDSSSKEEEPENDPEIKDEPSDDEEEKPDSKPIIEIKSKGKLKPILSGVSSFYSSNAVSSSKLEDSSSSDDDEEDEVKPKKKLTAAERAQLARQEEERISRIENELASMMNNPQSAEQFDRLLLANPDSSELWLKYIAMHVATTEIDKARAVGRRALETINMVKTKEKFNIWIALLNLEDLYGTRDSFDKLFEDAVRYNDSLEVYLNVIKMLASSGKLSEMEEKIRKVRAKEKQNTRMWLEVGQTYYGLGQFREARNIKEAALKSISDKKRQFDLIVKFGIMEFQSGELEQAVANFETILETYPAKVNIWIIYVDQLIKKKKIEEARKVLVRAVGQKLPPKSMKSLFQKFVFFEEQHGTEENVEIVKRKVKAYVHGST